MTSPVAMLYLNHRENRNVGNKDAIVFGLALFDTIVSITALVLAILGSHHIINMPIAAYASLYSVTGLITLIWIGAIITFCREFFSRPL